MGFSNWWKWSEQYNIILRKNETYSLSFSKLPNTLLWIQKLILKKTECVLIRSISSRKSLRYIKKGYSSAHIAFFGVLKYIVSFFVLSWLKNDRHHFYSSLTCIYYRDSDSCSQYRNLSFKIYWRRQWSYTHTDVK
jgi:hypothetical protein